MSASGSGCVFYVRRRCLGRFGIPGASERHLLTRPKRMGTDGLLWDEVENGRVSQVVWAARSREERVEAELLLQAGEEATIPPQASSNIDELLAWLPASAESHLRTGHFSLAVRECVFENGALIGDTLPFIETLAERLGIEKAPDPE